MLLCKKIKDELYLLDIDTLIFSWKWCRYRVQRINKRKQKIDKNWKVQLININFKKKFDFLENEASLSRQC